MAFWTVIGRGIDGEGAGRSFGITLNTDNNNWSAGGPSVAIFFTTRSGTYRVVVAPEHGTRLEGVGGSESAFFTNLTGLTQVGATGRGRASEKALTFTWELDSK